MAALVHVGEVWWEGMRGGGVWCWVVGGERQVANGGVVMVVVIVCAGCGVGCVWGGGGGRGGGGGASCVVCGVWCCVVWCCVPEVLMLLGWVLVIGGWYAWVLMHAVSTLTERGVQKSSQSPVVWQRGLSALCSGIDCIWGRADEREP